jgi:hypothetical protein
MYAKTALQERPAFPADWMASKSMRLAGLFGVLLTVSIAINAMIILAAGGRP